MCICEELFRLVLSAIQKKIQNNIGFNKREAYLSYIKLFLSSLTLWHNIWIAGMGLEGEDGSKWNIWIIFECFQEVQLTSY